MNNKALEGFCCKFIERSCKRSPYTSELNKAIGNTPQSGGGAFLSELILSFQKKNLLAEKKEYN
jgi:hypothetical protein